MSEPVRLADDTTLFLLEDEGLVFCEGTQGVYALNTTATFIWIRCEEGLSRERIAASLVETFEIANSKASLYVRDILVEWRERGLLAGAARPAPEDGAATGPGRVLPTVNIDLPADPPSTGSERSYRILNQCFRIGFTSAEQEKSVDSVLAHLATTEPMPVADTVSILDLGETHVVLLDGRPVGTCGSLAELGPLTSAILFNECYRKEARLLVIHAAAVIDGPSALLMPARGGWGKTSLAAAMIKSGYGYLSDDSVFLREGSFDVAGVPFSLCVKSAGLAALAPYFPDLAELPTHRRWDGQWVRYLSPPKASFGATRQLNHSVRWIVYPSYDADAPTSLRPIRRPDALRRLVTCCAPPVSLDRQIVSSLVHWIKDTECYELSISQLPTAVDLLREMLVRQ